MSEDLKNFAMFIPQGTIKIKKYPKLFGWNIMWIGKWVGIRKYKRIVPVREDKIFDFLFWRFVKPLDRKPVEWEFKKYKL